MTIRTLEYSYHNSSDATKWYSIEVIVKMNKENALSQQR